MGILYYIVCIYHFRQYITFENEAHVWLEIFLMHCKRRRCIASHQISISNLHLLTTPSLSATCHAKLQTVDKHFLIPYCTVQLTTAAGLVQKCTVLFAVGSVWGRIAFSPQANRSRVRLKACRDHLFKEVLVRLFGPLLVRTRVRFLHSHLSKRIAPRGKTNSSAIQPN